MLTGNDMKVGIWCYLAELAPDEITPHVKALIDVALSGAYEDGATLSKAAVKNVRAAVAARTGEAKTAAILPDWVAGSGTAADPHSITFPLWARELPPIPEPPAPVAVDYDSYAKTVLYQMAKARGLAVLTRMAKAEIVAALVAADEGA